MKLTDSTKASPRTTTAPLPLLKFLPASFLPTTLASITPISNICRATACPSSSNLLLSSSSLLLRAVVVSTTREIVFRGAVTLALENCISVQPFSDILMLVGGGERTVMGGISELLRGRGAVGIGDGLVEKM